MRPVNLIPPEERRGQRAPMRSGPTAYLVVGALAVALGAVTMMVLTGNTISERKAEVAGLEAEEAEAVARADALRPYAEFATVQQARQATVTQLAQSRFDWERVLRELAIVIPEDVWLVEMTGSVTPEVGLEGGAEVDIRDGVTGPALEIVGCGASHTSVARFVEALKDVDGVTRVSVGQSMRPEAEVQSDSGSAASESENDCRTRDFISRFEIVAAFDAVAVPTAPVTATVPTATPTATPAPAEPAATAATDTGGDAAKDSAAEQSGKARDAVNLVPGAVR